ncbi:MAG: hypothetical protein ACXWC0_30385 [Burkholderiales bacterium]
MDKLIVRFISEPIRVGLTWGERWKGSDLGLIACWERGREKSAEDISVSSRARDGELVVLPWKGGVDKPTKVGHKFGSLNYFAMWQGLRGENLHISLEDEVTLVCSRTKMQITYTPDYRKFAGIGDGT